MPPQTNQSPEQANFSLGVVGREALWHAGPSVALLITCEVIFQTVTPLNWAWCFIYLPLAASLARRMVQFKNPQR